MSYSTLIIIADIDGHELACAHTQKEHCWIFQISSGHVCMICYQQQHYRYKLAPRGIVDVLCVYVCTLTHAYSQ